MHEILPSKLSSQSAAAAAAAGFEAVDEDLFNGGLEVRFFTSCENRHQRFFKLNSENPSTGGALSMKSGSEMRASRPPKPVGQSTTMIEIIFFFKKLFSTGQRSER